MCEPERDGASDLIFLICIQILENGSADVLVGSGSRKISAEIYV